MLISSFSSANYAIASRPSRSRNDGGGDGVPRPPYMCVWRSDSHHDEIRKDPIQPWTGRKIIVQSVSYGKARFRNRRAPEGAKGAGRSTDGSVCRP